MMCTCIVDGVNHGVQVDEGELILDVLRGLYMCSV